MYPTLCANCSAPVVQRHDGQWQHIKHNNPSTSPAFCEGHLVEGKHATPALTSSCLNCGGSIWRINLGPKDVEAGRSAWYHQHNRNAMCSTTGHSFPGLTAKAAPVLPRPAHKGYPDGGTTPWVNDPDWMPQPSGSAPSIRSGFTQFSFKGQPLNFIEFMGLSTRPPMALPKPPPRVITGWMGDPPTAEQMAEANVRFPSLREMMDKPIRFEESQGWVTITDPAITPPEERAEPSDETNTARPRSDDTMVATMIAVESYLHQDLNSGNMADASEATQENPDMPDTQPTIKLGERKMTGHELARRTEAGETWWVQFLTDGDITWVRAVHDTDDGPVDAAWWRENLGQIVVVVRQVAPPNPEFVQRQADHDMAAAKEMSLYGTTGFTEDVGHSTRLARDLVADEAQVLRQDAMDLDLAKVYEEAASGALVAVRARALVRLLCLRASKRDTRTADVLRDLLVRTEEKLPYIQEMAHSIDPDNDDRDMLWPNEFSRLSGKIDGMATVASYIAEAVRCEEGAQS